MRGSMKIIGRLARRIRLLCLLGVAQAIIWRQKKLGVFAERYQDRRPTHHFIQKLWALRYDRWEVEVAFWGDPRSAVVLLLGMVRRHWQNRSLWWWEAKSFVQCWVGVRYAHLKYSLRPKVLKKRIHRILYRIPEVVVVKNNGITAVVLEKDLRKAKKVFVGYNGQFIVGGNYGAPFIPGRTMLFARPTTQAIGIRRPSAEVVTGTMDDMKELLRGCVVHACARQSMAVFVPFSGFHETLDWQKEQFPRMTLAEAYRLVWGSRRKAPATA